jgi:hypothetical protein
MPDVVDYHELLVKDRTVFAAQPFLCPECGFAGSFVLRRVQGKPYDETECSACQHRFPVTMCEHCERFMDVSYLLRS